MKKTFAAALSLLVLVGFAACKGNSSTSPSPEIVSPSPEIVSPTPKPVEPEIVSPSPETTPNIVQPTGDAFKVELDKNNMYWAKGSIPVIYLTTYFPEYIVEGNEKYPAKFMTFLPVETARPYGFRYDVASYYDGDSSIEYNYSAYDRYPFDRFFEDEDAANILKDGSDGIGLLQDSERLSVTALIDISDNFQKDAKLRINLSISNSQSRTTKEELAALCEQEVQRVMSTMQNVTLSGYWSQGMVSSVDLFSFYDEYIVTVDTSSLAPTSVENDKISYLFKKTDDEALDYSITINTYKSDKAVEKTLSDGTKCFEYATEYTTYRYFYIADAKYGGEVYLCIEGNETGTDYEAEFNKIWALISIKA